MLKRSQCSCGHSTMRVSFVRQGTVYTLHKDFMETKPQSPPPTHQAGVERQENDDIPLTPDQIEDEDDDCLPLDDPDLLAD